MKRLSLFLVIVLIIAAPTFAQKKVMLMNRIGPSQSTIYIANADGTGEHPLFPAPGFDYNASFSADGKWIVFTSERTGFGEADIYRVHPDGSGLERLTDNPAMDDQGALSPDGKQLAFVSTRESRLHNANIWILDLKRKKARNLTGGPDLQSTTPGSRMLSCVLRGHRTASGSHFRPIATPNGQGLKMGLVQDTHRN